MQQREQAPLPHVPVLLLEAKDLVRIARVSISCKRECAVWNIQWEVQFGKKRRVATDAGGALLFL